MTDSVTGSSAPAGWYPSPTTPGAALYWDGSAWTGDSLELPTAPVVPQPAAPAVPQPIAQPVPQPVLTPSGAGPRAVAEYPSWERSIVPGGTVGEFLHAAQDAVLGSDESLAGASPAVRGGAELVEGLLGAPGIGHDRVGPGGLLGSIVMTVAGIALAIVGVALLSTVATALSPTSVRGAALLAIVLGVILAILGVAQVVKNISLIVSGARLLESGLRRR